MAGGGWGGVQGKIEVFVTFSDAFVGAERVILKSQWPSMYSFLNLSFIYLFI